jgi:hypothetical protein
LLYGRYPRDTIVLNQNLVAGWSKRGATMALEFNCPNGHRVVCPEDRAGTEGRCPKCGATVRIPAASTAPAAAAAPAPNADVASRDMDQPQEPAEVNIPFLCPNGHRLFAPKRLEGQAGQCPQCGARFLVPLEMDLEQVEEVDLTDIDEEGRPLEMAPDTAPPVPAHSLCRLMRKLWDEKAHGATIEIHLEGGAMLVPDWFDERLSRLEHGLFASQAADGSVTMTVVAWNSVTRVIVRNVEGLPDGMFE